jgi:hypothetical protein
VTGCVSARRDRRYLLGFPDYVTKHLPIYDLDVPHVFIHAGTTGLLLDFRKSRDQMEKGGASSLSTTSQTDR